MEVSTLAKKEEAAGRMRALGIASDIIDAFASQARVSLITPSSGEIRFLRSEERLIVQRFEKRCGAVVYLGIRTFTSFGKMDAYLFVSDYPNEWKYDLGFFRHDLQSAFVHNWSNPENSRVMYVGPVGALGAELELL